jgi:Flp pilus assembly protein TadD
MSTSEDLSLLQRGLAHHNAGRFSDAEAIYRAVLARDPNNADALNLLGMLAGQTGNAAVAVELGARAVALRPDIALFHQSLAESLRMCGRFKEAVESSEHALALDRNSVSTLRTLGMSQIGLGAFSDGLETFSRLCALLPGDADAHTNRGACLLQLLRPGEAVESFKRAIAIDASRGEAFSNFGRALLDLNQSADAIGMLRRAVTLRPDDAAAHFNLACALLVRGQFEEGWKEFEWRRQTRPDITAPLGAVRPYWDGRTTSGKRILLCCEEGLGDAIQFIRFVPRLIEGGAKVIVVCPPELMRLFASVRGNPELSDGTALPAIDFYAPLMSLGRLLGTDLNSIPSQTPYLWAEAERVEYWRRELAPDSQALRVGLSWAGNPAHANDRNRSIAVEKLGPLASVKHVVFYSLQKRASDSVAPVSPAGMRMHDFAPRLTDIAETAAVIANLDLVISVDSGVAHLAGALGKPVWVLVPFAPDWRWITERVDSPWYPTMRLYRQTRLGDWTAPVDAVRADLEALAMSKHS